MSIMGYVFKSLTRTCSGTQAQAGIHKGLGVQVVIHKGLGTPSNSFVHCVGLCLSEDGDQIRTRVMNWIIHNWHSAGDFGDGTVRTLDEIFRAQFPFPNGNNVMKEGRDGLKVEVVKDSRTWARLMKAPTTYPDYLFRCAVALFFQVQFIIQHLEPTPDEVGANLETYVQPVGPTRREFLFWEEIEEIWYWGHKVEDECLEGCSAVPVNVVFDAPDIVDTGSVAPSAKKARGALSAPGLPVSGPVFTYVRARGYPRPPCSIAVEGVYCEEEVWVHLCQGGEAESFFESFAGALNNYRAGSSTSSKAIVNASSIKRDVRAFIDANSALLAGLIKKYYHETLGTGMVMRAVVAGCEDLKFKPQNPKYWLSYNMSGEYFHDYLWFKTVGNIYNVQFIVVNEAGMHPDISHE